MRQQRIRVGAFIGLRLLEGSSAKTATYVREIVFRSMNRLPGNSATMEEFGNTAGEWQWSHPRWRTLILFFTFLILSTTTVPRVSADLANESAILLSIKQAWGNPAQLSSWSLKFNTCSSWVYVTCDSQNTTITGLYNGFSTANVRAPLPASIGDLVNLETLGLSFWGLIGEVPSSIGRLRNLTILQLGSNSLSGPVPTVVGNLTQLTSLDLDTNNFTGGVPSELSTLQQLTYMSLSNNHLSGPLPSWIGSFPLLTSLYMENNYFTGNFPPSLGNLSSLQMLVMTSAWQTVAGNLPPELGKLQNLAQLVLDYISFDGSIPDSLSNLTNLQTLTLTSCTFTGVIPPSLGNLTFMSAISLDSNQLSGPIPDEFENFLSLNRLVLSKNTLSGPIPTQLSPSITYLDLHTNNLSGPIPAVLSKMTNLSYLDLSDNFLTGGISQSLALLPELSELLLQGNCLNGTIPLYNRSNTVANFGQTGNSNCFNATQICKCAVYEPPLESPSPSFLAQSTAGSDNPISKTAERVYIAVGVVAGSILALMALLVVLFMRHKRELKPPNPSTTYRGPVRIYNLQQIKEATNDFSTNVGQGAFGTVYRAVFSDGTVAAVKRFDKKRPVESFEKEVDLLSNLNHRFLVNLVGYCEDLDAGEHILLYEFMDRGNLNENLHDRANRSPVPLTWEERVRVLISVGHGIDYLHYGTSPPMIHRDIKSANILLSSSGSSLIAKVADFGLGKKTEVDANIMTAHFGNEPPKDFATQIAGTPGYFDPEYLTTSVLTAKTDVYSYGVVLLELITGKRPVLEDRLFLANWAKPYLDSEEIWSILDPNLKHGSFDEEQLRAVAELAHRCTEHDARNRPTIREVVGFLSEVFSVETRMVNASLRAPSNVDFSETDSMINARANGLNGINDFAAEGSMNYTQSEILPRD